MTWPHREPEEPRPSGPGCGGCAYLGWGPRGAIRCRHPEGVCWTPARRAGWALGCERRVEWGTPTHPLPVSLAAHGERYRQEES
ncbi:MAG: hypothetical protein Kow0092_11550 [Deferrisomatales bacterium]